MNKEAADLPALEELPNADPSKLPVDTSLDAVSPSEPEKKEPTAAAPVADAENTPTSIMNGQKPPWSSSAPLSDPPTLRKTPSPPWSVDTAAKRSLPPPPVVPRIVPSSAPSGPLPGRSSAPPLAVARNVAARRSFAAADNADGNPRKAIILGGALAIVFWALYVGRDKLMGVAPPAPIPEAAGASAPAKPESISTLKASAKQEGVTLVVDGKPAGALPLEVKGLSPGAHSVSFEAGARYASRKMTVTVAPGEMKELEPVSLAVTNGAATFDVKPAGASLALVAVDERRELADYSHPIDVDNSKSWMLEASKPGYRTLAIPIFFEDQAEKTFVVSLEETSAQSPRVAAKSEATLPAALPSDVSRPVAAKPTPAGDPSASKSDSPVSGNCTLSIDSTPPSHLTLDGHPIGTTPKTGISVPAGTHSVMFVAERGKKATIVICKSGEQKTMNVQLPTH